MPTRTGGAVRENSGKHAMLSVGACNVTGFDTYAPASIDHLSSDSVITGAVHIPSYDHAEDASISLADHSRAVFDTVRNHYRDGIKSSNKRRVITEIYNQRALMDYFRWECAVNTLTPLQQVRAPLIDRICARTGNCSEMAYHAVVEARLRGLVANVWGFMNDQGGISHEFAVIQVPAGAGREPAEMAHDGLDWQNAWVVDPWAGICCPGSDYHDAFKAKMEKWQQEGKQIFVGSQWLPAQDPRWLAATIGATPIKLRHNVIPDYAVQA